MPPVQERNHTPEPVTPPIEDNRFIARLVDAVQKQKPIELDERISPRAEGTAAPIAAPHPKIIACMVTHGMGQQVPFETASDLAEAFCRGRQPRSVQANRVHLANDADLISRLELIYDASATEPETHVHIYEGYWAPLTEGKITYVQALSFLFSGAYAGIKSSFRKTWNRWIFGGLYPLPVKKHTLSTLILLVCFLALGALLAYFCGVEMEFIWKKFHDSTAGVSMGALLDVRHHLRVSVHAFAHRHFHEAFFRNLAYTLLLLVLALVYRKFINLFIIQFMGDVAIYVSSHKVSEFEEIRNAIQTRVLGVSKQVVAAQHPKHDPRAGTPLYDGFIFVGHSLGSVIAYDVINALIVWDNVGCEGEHNLVGRIQRFITFGSPLDKTAFLFRNQVSEDHHLREQMAGLMQPLVLDYALRPFPWVNLYSNKDIVSGHLDYYDIPGLSQPSPSAIHVVHNRVDPAAWIPIWAHVQYWQGQTLSDELLAGLNRP